jgi:hypothetical protein
VASAPLRACLPCPASPTFPGSLQNKTLPASASASPRRRPSALSVLDIFCVTAVGLPESATCLLPTHHSLYTVLSSISTKAARGDHTTLLSEPASLLPIYTTRLLSFTLPFPRPPQITFRQLVLESSTGIARASYSYFQSPPSSSSPVPAQPCPALLETAPPGLPSLKRARHHVSTRHCYTNHRQPREYGPQRSQRQGDLPRRGLW